MVSEDWHGVVYFVITCHNPPPVHSFVTYSPLQEALNTLQHAALVTRTVQHG